MKGAILTVLALGAMVALPVYMSHTTEEEEAQVQALVREMQAKEWEEYDRELMELRERAHMNRMLQLQEEQTEILRHLEFLRVNEQIE